MVDRLRPRRERVQSALRGGVLVSLARRGRLCGLQGPNELAFVIVATKRGQPCGWPPCFHRRRGGGTLSDRHFSCAALTSRWLEPSWGPSAFECCRPSRSCH